MTASNSPLPKGWQGWRAALERLDNLSASSLLHVRRLGLFTQHSPHPAPPCPVEHPLPFLPLSRPASPSHFASLHPSPTWDHESQLVPSRCTSRLSHRESSRLKNPACGEWGGGPPSCWSWAGAHLNCPRSATFGGGSDLGNPEAARAQRCHLLAKAPGLSPAHNAAHTSGLVAQLDILQLRRKGPGDPASPMKQPIWGAPTLALVSLSAGGTLRPILPPEEQSALLRCSPKVS